MWQSEGQVRQPAGALMTGGVSGQVVRVSGLRTLRGAEVGVSGAGQITVNGAQEAQVLDPAVPATDLIDAGLSLAGQASIPFMLGYEHARAEIAAGRLTSGSIIGGNAWGGLPVERFMQADTEPYGRNQFFWMQQVEAQAAAKNLTVTAPFLLHFVGTSGKTQAYGSWKAACNTVWTEHLAEMARLFGGDPKPILIQNAGDTNGTNGDLYEQAAAQYDLARDFGGHFLLSQRDFLINDNNIHMSATELARQGERAAWGVAEIKAGRKWSPWASITKSGATVTVSFDLRPSETLVERVGKYANYGGDAVTAANYGFEADGGVNGVTFSGNTVTVTLANPAAAWMRFAMQRQNVSTFGHVIDGATYHMSAHRTTLAPSETKPSARFPAETMWRDLPGLQVLFDGDQVNRLDGTPFEGAP